MKTARVAEKWLAGEIPWDTACDANPYLTNSN